MESTENYIKQIADVHHFAEEVARAMIDIKMPEFAFLTAIRECYSIFQERMYLVLRQHQTEAI